MKAAIAAATAAFLFAAAIPPSALAQQSGDELAAKIVNDPGSPDVTGAKAALRDDPVVQGGKALRVDVPRKGANPWDSALGSAVKKPIKAGDKLLLAFYARLEKGEGGAARATLPFAGVQLTEAPYTPVFQQAVDIGPEWTLVKLEGKADRNYAAGKLKVTIHLASAKQVVDFGPLILLDQGQ